MEQKEEKKAEKLALVLNRNEKALLIAMVFFIKKTLKINFSDFDPEKDIFFTDNSIKNRNFDLYSKIIVIDYENKLKEDFLVKNHKKIFIWYAGKNLIQQKRIIFINVLKTNFYQEKSGDLAENIFGKNGTKNTAIIKILNILLFVEDKKTGILRMANRVIISLYVARLKDFQESTELNFLEKTLKALCEEFLEDKDSPFINSLIKEYGIIKKGRKKAKKVEITNPEIGLILVVMPKKASHYLIDKKYFFEEGLKNGYNAVAVKNPIGATFDLCLSNKAVKEFGNEIPAVERINGCRFIVEEEYLFSES